MIPALLFRYWQSIAIAALALGLVGACHQRDQAIRAQGVATERMRVADSTLTVRRAELAHVDTLVVHDTVRVRATIVRLDTLRETVLTHLTDTVVVKQFVAATDTMRRACSELSNDCALFRATATATIHTLEHRIAATPPVKSCVPANLIVGALGVGLGYLLPHR